EIINRVVMEGMTLAIGVSVGTAQLGASESGDAGGMDDDEPDCGVTYHYPAQSAIALCGPLLFAANIAPTHPVGMIARQAPARARRDPGVLPAARLGGALVRRLPWIEPPSARAQVDLDDPGDHHRLRRLSRRLGLHAVPVRIAPDRLARALRRRHDRRGPARDARCLGRKTAPATGTLNLTGTNATQIPMSSTDAPPAAPAPPKKNPLEWSI